MYDHGRVRSPAAVDEYVRPALHALHGLTLLRGVLDDSTGRAVLRLLTALADPETKPATAATMYSNALCELVAAVNREGVPALPDAWQAYLVTRLIDDDNPWSAQIERRNSRHVSLALHKQAERDLRTLQSLFNLDADMLLGLTRDAVTPSLPELRDAWIPWCDLATAESQADTSSRHTLVKQIVESSDWAELVTPLEQYWSQHGTGPLARYSALRWQGVEGGLQGIAHSDQVQLAALIGYEHEQTRLRTNIERFLAGLPAHDALLYGPPGTGKSSTVKALANSYAEQGLRLVEVRKEYLHDLPGVAEQLRKRAPRYLIFIDDLSFEEHETEYKVLKMLLEGTAEARPANVLIYATTNRMNLVREHFSDRGKPTEELQWRDTMDEKQSLVHRFGLRITFSAPDQKHYLSIALGLARLRGIMLPEEEIQIRALQWERQHIGRSGRVARQFVDDLEAEIGNNPSSLLH